MAQRLRPPPPEPSKLFKPDEATVRRDRRYIFIAVMLVTLAICLAGLLSGCATENLANNCAGWRAIHPSREDVLTRGTKEQIIAHNEFGVHRGCWTP